MVSTGATTSEENLIRFLKERGEATLDEISSALNIPKYGPNSVYAILYSLKSKNIVERRGNKWTLIDLGERTEEKLLSENKTQVTSLIIGGAQKEQAEGRAEPKCSTEKILEPIAVEENKFGAREVIKTGTILDKLFLKFNGDPLGGIPSSGQFIVTGPLNSGKSLFVSEVAIKVAHGGLRVLYAVLDDFWRPTSGTFGLERRLAFKAKALGLDWNIISNNICIMNPQQIDEMFLRNYEEKIRGKSISLAIIDPINRLKGLGGHEWNDAIIEIINLNRAYGVTGIFIMHVNNRNIEVEEQTIYFVDGIIEIIPARVIVNDNVLGVGRLRAIRVARCKLCGINDGYILAYITHNGLIRPLEL